MSVPEIPGITGIAAMYWENYQNKVLPVDFAAYQQRILALDFEPLAQEVTHNLSGAGVTMNEDLGCEHSVNQLVNFTGKFVLGVRTLLSGGAHVRFIGNRFSAMEGLDITIQYPDQIDMGGRDCVNLHRGQLVQEGKETILELEYFETPAMDEITIEIIQV